MIMTTREHILEEAALDQAIALLRDKKSAMFGTLLGPLPEGGGFRTKRDPAIANRYVDPRMRKEV